MSDFSNVEQLQQQAQQSAQNVAGLTAQSGTLPQMLRQAVSERLSGSPLFKQREEATSNFITALPQARTELAQLVQQGAAGQPGGQILSPNQQQSILSGRRAALTVPLMSLNDLLQAQTGGVETAVQGGLGAFNAQLQAAQMRAQLQQQSARDALELLLQKSSESRAERELALKESGAESDSGGDLSAILAAILGNQLQPQESAQPTEAKPTGTPSQSFVSRILGGGGQVTSPQGQWIFVDGEWLPIVD